MAKDRVGELEASLAREKQERAEADERATRANERARQADEAYRKLQLELVSAKDEASAARDEGKHLQEKLTAFEVDLGKLREVAAIKAASLPPPKASSRPPAKKSAPPASASQAPAALPAEVSAQVESMLARIEGLREMLATAAIELSQLHSDEVALGKKRSRVLSDACALLARAVGATGQAPPPIPSASLESRLTIAPVVDISEVADLIESLRPPRAPKVE
ncbi:hypothetical protein BH11MYX4_BH11MYX4_06770 [soil metagenome]